jgi:parallel beta-helix repeat protein
VLYKNKILLTFLLLTAISFASNYYVSATNGNDLNSGTKDFPFKTILHGLSKLNAGDTLFVEAGNYGVEGDIYIGKSGTSENPIVIKSTNPGNAEIKSIKILRQSWLHIIGFKITGEKKLPVDWKDMPEIVIDDPSIQIDPLLDWDDRYPLILNKYKSYAVFNDYGTSDTSWQNQYTQGIYLESCDNIIIGKNAISLHTVGIELAKECEFVTITQNEISHCLDAIYGAVPGLLNNFSYANSIISGNYIHQIYREGIRLTGGANNNLIEYNTVHFSGHSHIVTYGAGGYNTIRNNVVRFGGYYTETMRHPGSSGISIHSGGPGNLVDGNTITHQYDITMLDGNGVITDYNPDGAVVVNNIIYKVMGAGLNSIYSGNNLFIHNTIINAGENTSSSKNGMAVKLFSEVDKNNVIANNIFFNCFNGGIFAKTANLSEQKYIDHNLYFFSSAAPLAADGTNPANFIYDLAGLREKGFGLYSMIAIPQIVDTAGLNFKLLESSPAIARGTAAYSFQHDRNRQPRNNPPALGALEFDPSTDIEEEEELVNQFRLYQNYPNPFNPTTTIKFGLAEAGLVDLRVYNILGQEVTRLVNGNLEAGYHEINFDATSFSSGMYVYRIDVEGKFSSVKKMLLVK